MLRIVSVDCMDFFMNEKMYVIGITFMPNRINSKNMIPAKESKRLVLKLQ